MSKQKGFRSRSQEEIEFNQKLGERIEVLRMKARVSQVAMAQALGITTQRLYWYEAGRSAMPIYLLVRFAAEIGVTLDVICKQNKRSCVPCLQIQKSLIAS